MKYTKTILVMGIILLGGCATLSEKPKQHGEEFKSTTSMNNSHTYTAQTSTPLYVVAPPEVEITQQRNKMIEELEKAYKVDVEDKLPYALSYISSAQVEDYETKKKAGFWGAAAGLVATTLNVASKANIVTSTFFVGLQTLAINNLVKDDTSTGLMNPISHEKLEQNKSKIKSAHDKYIESYVVLKQTEIMDSNWDEKYFAAYKELKLLKLELQLALPPKSVEEIKKEIS